ncbi:hypothetical protein WS98_00015 [Burkholderia territorii]|nr:hypothetical protein WS98_00015 [Burkholderia territorii]
MLQLSRTVYRYESVARDQSAREMRIKEITQLRVHYGAPRVYVKRNAVKSFTTFDKGIAVV